MKNYILEVELTEEDIESGNVEYILNDINRSLQSGFKTGIDFPVNWKLVDEKANVITCYKCKKETNVKENSQFCQNCLTHL